MSNGPVPWGSARHRLRTCRNNCRSSAVPNSKTGLMTIHSPSIPLRLRKVRHLFPITRARRPRHPAPVPAPEAPSRNEKPEPATLAAPVARTTPSRPDVPAAPPSGPIREAVRNSSPTAVLRAPAPSAADPVSVLIERGDAMLALHDIGSARLLYERAAKAGNSRAATGVGKTFDPNFLRREGAVGLQPNRSEAINWYQKAAALGDPEAAVLLRQLQN